MKKENIEPDDSYLNKKILKTDESDTPPIVGALEYLYAKYKDCNEGKVASYIPELSKADPASFSISLATIDGKIYNFGDQKQKFTIQSISKPFIYGLILESYPRDEVIGRLGVEPTGDRFDSIIKLNESNKPHNPMVNAGAIVAADMIKGKSPSDRLDKICDVFSKYLGRHPSIDMSVFVSEKNNSDRNKSLAYLLNNFGNLNNKVEDTLDLYFQQCSMRVSSADLAVMAATLANGGTNPITQEQAIHPRYIRDVLSVMLSCGMYDYSGEWVFNIGMPAKSAVSGGLTMVIPGVGGLGIHSPLLDEYGNSIRAVRVCKELSEQVGLHVLDALFSTASDRTLNQ